MGHTLELQVEVEAPQELDLEPLRAKGGPQVRVYATQKRQCGTLVKGWAWSRCVPRESPR